MRVNSTHKHSDRGLDPYFSPQCAAESLLKLEPDMPQELWEPAVGAGDIAWPLMEGGKNVFTSDIKDYGFPHTVVQDYLTSAPPPGVKGLITNPPYRKTRQFVTKAIAEVPFVAMLLPLSFLEGVARHNWYSNHKPARVWVSSRRMPMMHRLGWTGKKSTSNKAYAWFVWEIGDESFEVRLFDWKKLTT
ncbi:class I SAM-dependent methyltransferase [Methylocystis hirsuta]|uniref:Class I SAM-dependent methyltransferase n=1 Tax=Methylocystis hirsuta TaxID=369798 RepID=A0A3M9XN39_9HYPH|nr:class I SAM-dependent methyltransferase [Methylocystis hirsuta]RNJ49414.1 class I SAM-dependent methyltransferase [Methylocystis hirsuta]